MDKIEVMNIMEAIMFALGRPISPDELNGVIDVSKKEIEDALEAICLKYSQEESGISCVKVREKYQLVTNKKYYSYVEQFMGSNKKENLSNAVMEVLSIIAYNPKITKSEIENIRGAACDSQVSKLVEYGLIEEVGRLKVAGRPAIFEVTNEFLRSMGLNSIEELPDFDAMKRKELVLDNEIEE